MLSLENVTGHAEMVEVLHITHNSQVSTKLKIHTDNKLYLGLVVNIRKHSHITPVLRQLHWLPVKARIHFKVPLLTFKAIHRLAPSYIQDLIKVKSKSSCSLRSDNGILLLPPSEKMLVTLGGRSFHAAAPQLWNSLPADIRTIVEIEKFKKSLKTYLFIQIFLT